MLLTKLLRLKKAFIFCILLIHVIGKYQSYKNSTCLNIDYYLEAAKRILLRRYCVHKIFYLVQKQQKIKIREGKRVYFCLHKIVIGALDKSELNCL